LSQILTNYYYYVHYIFEEKKGWYRAHKSISLIHEALKISFPNHNIDCLLLGTTEDCTEYQFVHTDESNYTCSFLPDNVHCCKKQQGGSCPNKKLCASRDIVPFTVFWAIEEHTCLLVGDGFDVKTSSIKGPKIHPIDVGNGFFITGSTPHCGVPFPLQILQRATSGPARVDPDAKLVHFRVFYNGYVKKRGSGFTPDTLSPQWKLDTSVNTSEIAK